MTIGTNLMHIDIKLHQGMFSELHTHTHAHVHTDKYDYQSKKKIQPLDSCLSGYIKQ